MPVRHAVSAVVFAVVAGSLVVAPPARASVEFQKKAKEAGITSVTNCQSCHVAKLPKKTEHELNEMGNWLKTQKETRKVKDIDVTWLKDYKPAAK
jgi:acylphosphatase